jgi:DNA-binding response OmpR family regulator
MPKGWKRRILYVGRDLSLLSSLQDALTYCVIVRCPRGKEAQSFIAGIDYSVLVFDEQLSDMTGAELEQFTRSLSDRYRQHTPVLIVKESDEPNVVIGAVVRELSKMRGGRFLPNDY